jgi:hypothetical protein
MFRSRKLRLLCATTAIGLTATALLAAPASSVQLSHQDDVSIGSVELTGTGAVDEFLTTQVSDVTPPDATLYYIWLRDGQVIIELNGSSGTFLDGSSYEGLTSHRQYQLRLGDDGHQISVKVVAVTSQGRTTSKTSNVISVGNPVTVGGVHLTGTAQVGTPLWATIESLEPAQAEPYFIWKRDGQPLITETGANAGYTFPDGAYFQGLSQREAYWLTPSDLGHQISVTVVAHVASVHGQADSTAITVTNGQPVTGLPHSLDVVLAGDTDPGLYLSQNYLDRYVGALSNFWSQETDGAISQITYNYANVRTISTASLGSNCGLYNVANLATQALGSLGLGSPGAYTSGQHRRHLMIITKGNACGFTSIAGQANGGFYGLNSGGYFTASVETAGQIPEYISETAAHEFGHTLGLMHAGQGYCPEGQADGDFSYSGQCTVGEYQDFTNILGYGSFSKSTLNGWQRQELGLISAEHGLINLSDAASGDYQLAPSFDHTASNQTLHIVDNQGQGQPEYYVDYGCTSPWRGDVSLQCGIAVRRVAKQAVDPQTSSMNGGLQGTVFPDTIYLRAHREQCTAGNTHFCTWLPAGETITTANGGIKITALTDRGRPTSPQATATVRIEFPHSQPTPTPSVSATPPSPSPSASTTPSTTPSQPEPSPTPSVSATPPSPSPSASATPSAPPCQPDNTPAPSRSNPPVDQPTVIHTVTVQPSANTAQATLGLTPKVGH